MKEKYALRSQLPSDSDYSEFQDLLCLCKYGPEMLSTVTFQKPEKWNGKNVDFCVIKMSAGNILYRIIVTCKSMIATIFMSSPQKLPHLKDFFLLLTFFFTYCS